MSLRLNPAQIALAALCGMLSILLGYMLFAPLPDIPAPAIQTHADPVDDAPPARFDAPPKQAFAEVDDRSVFNPLRVRVIGPSAPGAANTNSLPADLSLVGVILDGDTRLALFKSAAAPLAVGVSVGGSIEGWQVTRVGPDEVGMRSAAGEQAIKLAAGKPSGQPPGQPVGGPGNSPLNAAQANAQARFQANMAQRNNPANNNANNNANNANNNANNSDDDDN
jgi:hypothetical protein